MRFKNVFLLLFCFFLSCKTYSPFKSYKEKKEALKLIQDEIKLANNNYKLLKKTDTILFEIANSLKVNYRKPLLERRIDSLLKNKYNKYEFIVILKLDRINTDFVFEFDREKKSKTYFEIKTYEEAEKFFRNIDSIISKQMGIRKSN
ncbi:hypothetical protein [Aurantibacter aestuarii]|uniref:Lipoprotein n=1 Tax=Aurantibacter aestuarii TaxID=1266046 RepID=A0A2T1NBW9_9FLAO|nr:hypothetical protein [Aurantibacter aestuarii]PSG89943.1 hypothetical protein C7H52_01345 [Aurantibacter aestuarii]